MEAMSFCTLPADPLHGDVLSPTSHSRSSPDGQGNPPGYRWIWGWSFQL